MKSPREPFENALRDRLFQYSEDPDKDLWKGIASKLSVPESGSDHLGWTASISILSLSLLFSAYQPEPHIPIAAPDKSSLYTVNSNCLGQGGGIPGTSNIEYSRNDGNKSAVMIPVDQSQSREIHATNLVAEESSILQHEMEMTQSFRLKEPRRILMNDPFKAVSARVGNLKQKVTMQSRKKTKFKKVLSLKNPTLYFMAMPTAGYQQVEPNPNGTVVVGSVDKTSAKQPGFRLDLGLEWPLSKRVKTFVGALYYQQKQSIQYMEEQLGQTDVSAGPGLGNFTVTPTVSEVPKTIEYEMKNLGLQAGLLYQLSKDRYSPFVSEIADLPSKKKGFVHWIGASLELHKALNQTTESNGFSYPTTYVFADFHYRLQYPNIGRLKAHFQPIFFYSLYANQNSNSSLLVRPYGFGLSLGCTYSF